MNAPCSVRKDKSGIFAKIKAISFSDKITVITYVVMIALLCLWPVTVVCFERVTIKDALTFFAQYNSLICALFAFAIGIITTNFLSKRDSAEFYAKFPIGDRKTLFLRVLRDIVLCICIISISFLIMFLLSLVLSAEYTASDNLSTIISTLVNIVAMYMNL